MRRPSRWIALLAGIGLALAINAPAFAYVHQVTKFVIVSPDHSTMTCGIYYRVKATVLDKKGHGIKGVTVKWSFKRSPSNNDKFQYVATTTNKHGWTYNRVKLACRAGSRTIRAKVGVGKKAVSGLAVVHVRIPHKSSSATGSVLGITSLSLPSTSTLPRDASTDGLPTPAIPAMIAVLAAAGLILRRFALTRR